MEVFIRGLPPQCTEKSLSDFLRPHLQALGIFTYLCQNTKAGTCALLTIADEARARKFLATHGSAQGRPPTLRFQNRSIYCSLSKNTPNEYLLKSLEFDEKKRVRKPPPGPVATTAQSRKDRVFRFDLLHCGQWDYCDSRLTFSPYFAADGGGQVMFGKKWMAILLDTATPAFRIDISYAIVEHILFGSHAIPTVALTLAHAPKLYRTADIGEELQALFLSTSANPGRPKKTRITSLGPRYQEVFGSCFVYQLRFSDWKHVALLQASLKKARGMPPQRSLSTPTLDSLDGFESQLTLLERAFSSDGEFRDIPFTVQFQAERLARDGILPPSTVLKLLPAVRRLVRRLGERHAVAGLTGLRWQIPTPGPGVDSRAFDIHSLASTLTDSAQAYHEMGSVHDLVERHDHLALVHRATVTPTGIYLTGPEPEVTNRVLRKHHANIGHFLRVTFADENGDPVRFDPTSSLDEIYQRFRAVMDSGIKISGRKFQFLGFSHSSLRSQTCWFMSPFYQDQSLHFSRLVISSLGDFSAIRSPAKCAARIGQAFSDTTAAVEIKPESLQYIPDVVRNGRYFSDGVGTISRDLLFRIWREWKAAHSRTQKPTCLQIRFAGAKGMVSLDSRLDGEQLCLRESMNKFPASGMWDVEMCGGNFKSLPMYLNRPLIKILEDLGVPCDVFLHLQNDALETLRMMIGHPLNAAKFLEMNFIGTHAKLPSLIRMLHDLGLSFHEDEFLHRVVEIASVVQLRELKYKSRIPVPEAITLYGIMDETGHLREGEIYCVTETSRGRLTVLTGKTVVTRSPAHHPGDVQVATAVDVPGDSPLRSLRNCVVFSQHGSRDLPSQLSGGDLDGDLYNIIYDPRLMPWKVSSPSDYPRPKADDIGREVKAEDMTEFFIKFMKTDQLGRISLLHLQLADRHADGTFHPDCIELARLASVAVDFSKTGIPVDLNQIPKTDNIRPDFMAPGPRVLIEPSRTVFDGDDDDEEGDVVVALDPQARRPRFYESKKVIGKLYRAIDERKFLEDFQRQSAVAGSSAGHRVTLLDRLWEHVKNQTQGIMWTHCLPLARQIREVYEGNLLDTMYQYSSHPFHPLNELEVFSGSILGKAMGAPTKKMRESAMEMKERFDKDVEYIVKKIKEEEDDGVKPLERSIACLFVAMTEPGNLPKAKLRSFRYVAAAACLSEVQEFRKPPVLEKYLYDWQF